MEKTFRKLTPIRPYSKQASKEKVCSNISVANLNEN